MKHGEKRKSGLTPEQIRHNIQKSFLSRQRRVEGYVKPLTAKSQRNKEQANDHQDQTT